MSAPCGFRIAGSGSAREQRRKSDVLHPIYEVECKYQTGIGITAWWKQVIAAARDTHKQPLLIVKDGKSRHGQLVVMHIDHFAELMHTTYPEVLSMLTSDPDKYLDLCYGAARQTNPNFDTTELCRVRKPCKSCSWYDAPSDFCAHDLGVDVCAGTDC